MSVRGEWDIKLYKKKNKVAMYINEYAGQRAEAKNLITELKAERVPIYRLKNTFKEDIEKIAEIYKGIQTFDDIEDKKIGVYIGKKCSNATEAKKDIKKLGPDKTSIYFIQAANCNEVKKDIVNKLVKLLKADTSAKKDNIENSVDIVKE